jgi:hypothetical protein
MWGTRLIIIMSDDWESRKPLNILLFADRRTNPVLPPLAWIRAITDRVWVNFRPMKQHSNHSNKCGMIGRLWLTSCLTFFTIPSKKIKCFLHIRKQNWKKVNKSATQMDNIVLWSVLNNSKYWPHTYYTFGRTNKKCESGTRGVSG